MKARIEERNELAKAILLKLIERGEEVSCEEVIMSTNRFMEGMYGEGWDEEEKVKDGVKKVAGYAILYQGSHFDGSKFCKVADVGTIYLTREEAEKHNTCHWPICTVEWEEHE